MEEDGPINFKALRAKFQEEALLAQSKTSRPAVAEKPKYLRAPAGQCTSVAGDVSVGVEDRTPAVPCVILRDGLRASGSKRPISFPPQPEQSAPSQLANGGGTTTRHSLKDRHMPLVLPVLPVKDQKMEPPAEKEYKLESEPGKEYVLQTRIKKKGLLLPFRSVKAGKVPAENGEEPAYADLTNRPCSAPCELPSVEKQSAEDGVSLHSDQSTTEYPPSSPDVPITPPPAETHADSDNRLMSTLERAKKRFSRRQILLSSKPRSLHSPDHTSREKAFPSPPKNLDGVDSSVPPPPCLPPLACISARPFFKANSFVRKPAFDKQLARDKVERASVKTVELHPPRIPVKRPLPDLRTLGSVPAKPPRPPLVDLSHHHAHSDEVSPGRGQTRQFEHPSVSNPVLDAPEFPDFENCEVETAECEAVDIAALELEALDVVCADLNTPVEFQNTDCEAPKPDLSVCDPAETSKSPVVQDLNLGSPNIIPLDPASFPEPINLSGFPEPSVPEQQSHSKEAAGDCFTKSRSDEVDVGAAECQSLPEETELSGHATWSDEIQTHPGTYQQNSYYETCDNVYEDVENINRFILSQTSNKRKGGLKNPYADNHPAKEEPCLQKWPRHPWGSISGEHAHFAHHAHSKEHSSPNTADYKEQRKREKQRLERERREQKEREKKENEMKKKFKVTGEEEPMYHAKVMVASKVRKNDLPVKSGDMVSIIRTTNCPKGKWLARDSNHKYGYISVMNVELNIKEMLELGKKAQAAGRGGNPDGDTISLGSRSSSHPVLTSSFTDDSEEWACEEETLSPSANESHCFPQQPPSLPEMACAHVGSQHTLINPILESLHTRTRHEALQKLAFFFQHSKDECSVQDGEGTTPTNAETTNFLCAVEEPPYPEQEADFTELELLPPPPLYADTF